MGRRSKRYIYYLIASAPWSAFKADSRHILNHICPNNPEFDEGLHEFELKLLHWVQQAKLHGPTSKIVVGTQVAVFFADLNKWIRAVVKAKGAGGLVHLWCTDYGFPLVAQLSDVVALARSMYGFQATKQAVHQGGLSNCVPAKRQFNVYTCSQDADVVATPMWSPQAIETFEMVVANAVSVQLKDIRKVAFGKKEHQFGRLMVTSGAGDEINILKW